MKIKGQTQCIRIHRGSVPGFAVLFEVTVALVAKQAPDEEKRNRADFIVDTSQDFDHARAQVRDILDAVAKMQNQR